MSLHRLRDAGLAAVARLPVRTAGEGDNEVLLIRPDHLGDLLFVGPGLRQMRQALPDYRLTLVVGPWSRDVAAALGHADEILTVPFPGFTRGRTRYPLQPYTLLARTAGALRRRSPAAAVILRDDHWWGALLARQAGIPIRIGADHPAVARYLTHTVPVAGCHWVQRNARLLDAATRALGGTAPAASMKPGDPPLAFTVPPEADEAAARLLARHGVDGRYIVIAPGTGAAVKLWPAERWARVASRVAAQAGVAVVLTGSAGEVGLLERVRACMDVPAASLAGETDLESLAAVLKRARLVAGVDSGPLHLAVALGRPTVHLYGPSSVADYGPWGDPARHRVITAGMTCQRCSDLSLDRPEGAACMVAISPAQVEETMLELLGHG